MSFRARLTSFFVLIVVVPMTAVGFLVFRLIDDSQTGKTDARVAGIASTAASVYDSASRQAGYDARTLARDLARTPPRQLRTAAGNLAREVGVVRVSVKVGGSRVVDLGDRTAIAPGAALLRASGKAPARTVTVSELTADQYAAAMGAPGTAVVVRSKGVTLGSSVAGAARLSLPSQRGTVSIGSRRYVAVTQRFAGFDGAPVQISVLSDQDAVGGSLASDRLLAAAFIAGFLLLAFFFSVLASRALHGQLTRFLEAARRLGGGDFSAPIQTVGQDEFALLGQEFNSMSRQLELRLGQLEQERSRVRKSIRRIGEAFASGLDREALMELALRTALDATEADRGRVSAREDLSGPLQETIHIGRLAGLAEAIHEAEVRALESDGIGEAQVGEVHLATVALGEIVPGGPTHGLITVCRAPRPFTEDDLELLRSLAARATLALSNVNRHCDMKRQAITDDLTGLATHGHFQNQLNTEMQGALRYQYPVGLIMLDLDDFKAVNDRYGHLQGDLVLRYVADALRETSREVDIPSRYGGEELALILPHTDLEGAYEIAERVRTVIEALVVPLHDGQGELRVTASVGAASSADGDKNALIAAADGALYRAKREGKNRTVRAEPETANVVSGE